MLYVRFPDTLQPALLNHPRDAPKARLHIIGQRFKFRVHNSIEGFYGPPHPHLL